MTASGAERKRVTLPTEFGSPRDRVFALRPSDGKVCPSWASCSSDWDGRIPPQSRRLRLRKNLIDMWAVSHWFRAAFG